ncbi:MAG: zinc-dependent metalloprotease [Actinomycetota bacterium]
MAATDVDWSMGSAAARLADWHTAIDLGRRVAGPGVGVSAVERARMREDLSDLVPECERLIADFTGLEIEGFRSRAWVMSRGEWIEANLRSMQRVLEPLAERVLAGGRSRAEFRRKALGAQIGGLLGYVSRKVLGQYDVFLPPDDEGLLYFVGPNLAEAERRFGLPPRDFRFWVAVHEVCHRVQFGATPWLSSHLAATVDHYLSTVSLDSGELLRQLSRAVDEVRSGRTEARGIGVFYLLLNDEQRELFHRTQGLMSLLEGHASYVMNRVADGRVADLPRMRRALSHRRRSGRVERSFQKAVGFDSKIQQYDSGERFVAAVVDRVGMDGFNAVWREEANLPTGAEIADPDRWIARVGP